MLNKVCFGSAILVFTISFSVFAIDGDVELLKFIADGYQTNREMLKTWETTINSDISEVYGQKDGSITDGWKRNNKINFLFDRDLGATRWNSLYSETIFKNGQKENREPTDYSGIKKGRQGYQMFFDAENSGTIRTLEVLPSDEILTNESSLTFNPVSVWDNIFPVVKMLRFYYDNKEDPSFAKGHRVIRKGNIVTFEAILQDEQGKDCVNNLVFDLSKGCNLVKFISSFPTNEVEWKVDYENIDNVYVPKAMSKSYIDKRLGSNNRTIINVEFNNKMVNDPVDASEFKFDKIGLRPGDNILDRQVGNLIYSWRDTPDDIDALFQETEKARDIKERTALNVNLKEMESPSEPSTLNDDKYESSNLQPKVIKVENKSRAKITQFILPIFVICIGIVFVIWFLKKKFAQRSTYEQ